METADRLEDEAILAPVHSDASRSSSCSRRRPPSSRTSPQRCTFNRYYDPATDQFVSVDPIVDQTGQPYIYTGDDPLNATDPLGDVSSTFACSGQGNFKSAKQRAQVCSRQRQALKRYQAKQQKLWDANPANHGAAQMVFNLLPLAPLVIAALPEDAAGGAGWGASYLASSVGTAVGRIAPAGN